LRILKGEQMRHFYELPCGFDGRLSLNVTLDFGDVHVGGVRELSGKSVVLEDDGLEHLLEVLVGVLITSVDAAVLHK
jgi:hypothetical protein